MDWEQVDDNKLRVIKDNTRNWDNLHLLTRRESVIITRLRIGHTLITHKHLFDKTNLELCICGEMLMVPHIMESCNRLAAQRKKYNIHNLKSLANNDIINLSNILEFLKRINIYNQI